MLGAIGAASLVAVAGCNPFSTSAPTITVTTEAPPPTTPLLGLLFKTRMNVQNLQAAVRADDRDADTLAMLLSDRQAHEAALRAEYVRTEGKQPPAASDQPTTLTSTDPDEIIALIRGDAAQAQTMFTDAMTGASRYEAELFASIAACVATHRMVLS